MICERPYITDSVYVDMDKELIVLSPHESKEALHGDVGLYIHIPFCVKRCHFCAFYLVVQEEKRIQRFLAALDREIRMYAAQLGRADDHISTVYVGGGTPTALSSRQLACVLRTVKATCSATHDCEVTVEATPESLTIDYLDMLQDANVTRLSLGIQTCHARERDCLGLSSTIEEALRGIRYVKESGFVNFNVDLIYGIPGQTFSSWELTLRQVLECDPAHLSCYALSVEEGTRFNVAFRKGALDLVETEVEQQFLTQAADALACAGYDHYEISNWAKPGYACRHNLRYWTGQDYIGLGPSAQSYVSGCRFGNVADLGQYCRQLEHGELPVAEREHLSIAQQVKERVVFGLRLLEGVATNTVRIDQQDSVWKRSLASLLDEEYLIHTDSRLALTDKGRQFADMVGQELL